MTSKVFGGSEVNGSVELTDFLSADTVGSIVDCQWTSPDGTAYYADEETEVKDSGKRLTRQLMFFEWSNENPFFCLYHLKKQIKCIFFYSHTLHLH